MALCYGLCRHLKGHDIVRSPKRVRVLEINLMLGRRNLMMAGLHLKSHLLQVQHNIPADIFRQVNGRHVKISRHLMCAGSGPSLLVRVKEKEFTFRTHIEHISHVLRPLDSPFEHIPRIAGKRGPVRVIHVADKPGHLALLGPPRKDLKGIQIRIQVHIRLVNPHKPFNGRSVKHAAVIQCLFKLAGSDGHILKHSEDIRKLEADKLHILLFHHTHDVLFTVFAHNNLPLLQTVIPTNTQRREPITMLPPP